MSQTKYQQWEKPEENFHQLSTHMSSIQRERGEESEHESRLHFEINISVLFIANATHIN